MTDAELVAHSLATARRTFETCKGLGDRALAQLRDGEWDRALDAESNSVAIVVKHMRGNMLSTGCYPYVVGSHGEHAVPGCFLQGTGPAEEQRARVVVVRSLKDVCFDTGDFWHACSPHDNLHPAFRHDIGGLPHWKREALVRHFVHRRRDRWMGTSRWVGSSTEHLVHDHYDQCSASVCGCGALHLDSVG